MNWTTLALVLIGWCLVGVGVAYLFGRFVRDVDTPENADGLVPPVVNYLHRSKHTKAVTQLRAAAPSKRRASGG